MKPSEELMLLLELNNFNIDKFKSKMQSVYEENGNLEIFMHEKYSDIIVSHYLFEDNDDYFIRNPLSYRLDWDKSVERLDQFKVKHIELPKEITLQELINNDSFNKVDKLNIIGDIFSRWTKEYKESNIKCKDNYKDMINLFPEKNKPYSKPSKIAILFASIFAIMNIIVFFNPSMLQISSISSIDAFVYDWNRLLTEEAWYTLLGGFTTILLSLYVFRNYSFLALINGVRPQTDKEINKLFKKWDKGMEKAISKQSKILRKYANSVVSKPTESSLLMYKLSGPSIKMDKIKMYVEMVEIKANWMANNYNKRIANLRVLLLLATALNILFIGVGFAIIRGLINV